MTTLREAAQQALKILENGAIAHPGWVPDYDDAITSLRAALAEQDDDLTAAWMAGAAEERKRAEQAQPVAWRYKPMVGSPWSLSDDGYYVSCKRDNGYIVQPLYTTPPAPQPLTTERLRDALVASRIIDPGAVEDPDDYDDGVTLHRIEALFRRIA